MPAINPRDQTMPDDAGRGPGVLITSSTTNLALPMDSRYLTVSTAGTVTGKLVGDSSDRAYIIPVGHHKLSFRSVTSVSSLVGFFTF